MSNDFGIELTAVSVDRLARAWDRAPALALQALTAATVEAGLLVEREWHEAAPKGATRAYEQSIAARPAQVSPERVLVEVGSSQPHVEFVEIGTRPHMPPVEPLVDWAKAKFGLDDEEARSVGYAVARKIRAHGTEGQHILAGVVEHNLDQVSGIFERAAGALAAKLAEVPGV